MKRIIHVDNSDFFRKQMTSFLESEGFQVESYNNTREASAAINAGFGDMVIMGLAFVDSEGDDFAAKIIESFSGPVIVVSSSIDKETEDRLIQMGIKAAVSKSGFWKDNLRPHLSELD